MADKAGWQGRAVFVLAITVGVCLVSLVIGYSSGHSLLKPDGVVWVAGAIGVCLGVVVTYVTGAFLRRRNGGDS